MATDPTRRIREREGESPLDLALHREIPRLAALEPSPDAPYITIGLDWRPDGQDPRKRPARQFIDQWFEAQLNEREYRDAGAVSMREDRELILTFLDEDVESESQGIVIVACAAKGVFEVLQLGLPVENEAELGPTPALARLTRLAEDFEPYAVLLADQHETTLAFVSQAQHDRSVWLESSDYPRHQQTGGWSQRRLQARAGERVSAFASDVAEEVRRALEETGTQRLVLVGDEVMTSALDEQLHDSVKSTIVGQVRGNTRASASEVIEETMPIVQAFERQAEEEAVRQLIESRGSAGLAALGSEQVLRALQSGQVMTLLMNRDFSQMGWVDYSLPLYGVGAPPKKHPAGGDAAQIVAVRLEEEVVRLAWQTSAEIEIVKAVVPIQELDGEDMEIPDAGEAPPRTEAARLLDEFGGIGALLRYAT